MAALMRGVDWGTTSLGPIETWPESLATAVDICMASRFPMAICWGPELALLYNDAYRPILGAKHPAAIGRPCYEVWSELVPIIEPMFDSVFATGKATWSDDLLLPMERHGYLEEAYFTVSYSAIRHEKRLVAGLFVTVAETTQHVLGHRRLQLSSELARRSSHATGAEEACRLAADAFEELHADVPASAIYLVEESEARLVATSRVDVRAMRTAIDLAGASPVASVVRGARPEECDASAVAGLTPGGRPGDRAPRRSPRSGAAVAPCWSQASTRVASWMTATATSSGSSRDRSARRSRTRPPMPRLRTPAPRPSAPTP